MKKTPSKVAKKNSNFFPLIMLLTAQMTPKMWLIDQLFIYSEKATKFCKISTVDFTNTTQDRSTVEISQNFYGLLRIYELHIKLGSHRFRELSLMTSHIRVGRGVQDSPQKGTL